MSLIACDYIYRFVKIMNDKRKFKYIDIYDKLKTYIKSDKKPGDKLDSEVTLSKTFNVNYHTIRKSLKLLEADGLIERRVGVGSFITSTSPKKTVQASEVAGAGIGLLILPDHGNYTMSMIEALDQASNRRGHYLNVRPIRNFDIRALRAVEQLKKAGCSSVIIPRLADCNSKQFIDFVKKSPLPVAIPEPFPTLEKNCFYQSGFSGHLDYSLPALAFNHFKNKGFRIISYLGPKANTSGPAQRRIDAYENLTERFGYPSVKGLVGTNYTDVDTLVNEWGDKYARIAVICFDDTYALRLITALHKFIYHIPSKFAIIGANNSPECVTSDPALSSIALPYTEMANGLIKHALALSVGQSRQQTTTGFGKLIIRKSC